MASDASPSAIQQGPCAGESDAAAGLDGGAAAPPRRCLTSNAREFEAAVHATDAAVCSSQKRLREHEMYAHRILQKPRGGSYPFHEDYDAFNALLEGVVAATRKPHPDLSVRSPPAGSQAWATTCIKEWGAAQLERGRVLERGHSRPSLTQDAALEAFTLMTRLNALLSAGK